MQSQQNKFQIVPLEYSVHEFRQLQREIGQYRRRTLGNSLPLDLADEIIMQYKKCVIHKVWCSHNPTKTISADENMAKLQLVELEAEIKSLLLKVLTGRN